MEHENSDIESDSEDVADEDDNETHVQSNVDDADDHSEPDWRQFAANYRGFQLDATQELLTSNLFVAVKSLKEYVTGCRYCCLKIWVSAISMSQSNWMNCLCIF